MADNFFGITDTGKQRQNNEDTFIAQKGTTGRYIIACVIDGVGGYAGGEIAAALAQETILQRIAKFSGEIIPLIIDSFHVANEKIVQEKQDIKEYNSMACVATLAIVDIDQNQFYYGHVGDTRLYLLRDGSLVKISHDQSFVGFLEDSGRLTEKEAMSHPKRNEIDKALGFKSMTGVNSDYIETGQSPFLPGDMLLLCSDGLTDMVNKATITDILMGAGSLKSKCAKLVDAANDNGGSDNITVVLVQNDKAPQQHQATMPAETAKVQNAPDQEGRQKQEILPDENIHPISSPKTNKGLVVSLLILTLCLAAACIWQYLNYKNQPVPQAVVVPVKKLRNPQEIKLQNAVNNIKGKTLVLTDTAFTSPVIISQGIVINQDSLYIKAKGKVVLQSDSAYHGAAFILSAKNKHILLDSLVFQNFNVAISCYNNALELKNVRFSECKLPVQNGFIFSNNKYISGNLAAAVFKTDSLPKINKYGAR
ncbi:MAG: hypothetical protein JWR67_3892 [Mucilaginibacter sp.]|nr:hypothetical protein [Mucilaginibacter sp.]